LDLVQLRYFLETAETQNVSKAAKKMYITQPALSKVITKLEKELDIKLFDRVGKSIRLNDHGKLAACRVKEALSILDSIRTEFMEMDADASGDTIRLRIIVGANIIPNLLAGFLEKWPDIKFSPVRPEAGDKQDLCITTPVNGILPEASRLLMEEEIMLAVPHNHTLAATGEVPLSSMRDEDFLSLDAAKPMRQLTDMFCKAAGFEPNVVMQTDNPSTLRNLIALGLGISFVPAVTWSEFQSSSNVAMLRISHPLCYRKI